MDNHDDRVFYLAIGTIYLLAIGCGPIEKVVMGFLTYYLPQLPHHAPGVSVARSLVLLAHSSHDLWTQLGESVTASWQRRVQQSPRAG